MGLLTIGHIAFQTQPHPQRPGQIQVRVALGEGARFLSNRGVVLNVAIGVDRWTVEALRAQNKPVPPPHSCEALVDTGASGLALDKTVVQALNLKKKGIVTKYTPAGKGVANMYFVALAFPGTNLRSYDMLRATEVDLTGQPFKCLIGRETMVNWHLHYNGQTGQISISD